MAQRDYAKPGEYYSADYLRISDLDANASFQTMFGLVRQVQKEASDADVLSADKVWPSLYPVDVSPVYRVFSRNAETFWRSFEFSTSQNAINLTPEAIQPGIQMIVTYASIRTESLSGEAYFHNLDKSIIFSKIYISSRSDFVGATLYVPIGESQQLYLTSTQGAKKLFCSFNAHFEQIRIVP